MIDTAIPSMTLEIASLLDEIELDARDVEMLLDARIDGEADFLLVDVREEYEWELGRITGTDYLVPTSSFLSSLIQLNGKKDSAIILYCKAGIRSVQAQEYMQQIGFKKVINLRRGMHVWGGGITKS